MKKQLALSAQPKKSERVSYFIKVSEGLLSNQAIPEYTKINCIKRQVVYEAFDGKTARNF